MNQFTRAIVRPPASNFADGLTTATEGAPNIALALAQHASYSSALQQCGLTLTTLLADLAYPDSTFVEDTAILTPHAAILCYPGATSRVGEVAAIRPTIEKFYSSIFTIDPPGTLDGGDICEAGTHFFLGHSQRTNEQGCRQLAAHLARQGYTSSVIDVRSVTTILHLKSGIACIGDRTLVIIDQLASHPEFRDYDLVRVRPEEAYAANCVRVNDRVLIPAGYPHLTNELHNRGFRPLPLDVSEFRKMDGGLSCLSLRF